MNTFGPVWVVSNEVRCFKFHVGAQSSWSLHKWKQGVDMSRKWYTFGPYDLCQNSPPEPIPNLLTCYESCNILCPTMVMKINAKCFDLHLAHNRCSFQLLLIGWPLHAPMWQQADALANSPNNLHDYSV